MIRPGSRRQPHRFAFIIWLVAALNSPLVLAIDEERFFEDYHTRVEPFFYEAAAQYLETEDGIRLHYRLHLQAEAAPLVLLITGRSEPLIKYDELSYDLFQLGYSIALYDHRGQGRSSRLLNDSDKGHIDNYAQYASDLLSIYEKVLKPLPKTELFAISHSMGGNILTIFSASHPDKFDKIILSSPMIDINTGNYPEWIAYTVTSLYSMLGLGQEYVWGLGPRRSNVWSMGSHTHSTIRKKKRLYQEERFPRHWIGGPTMKWLKASLDATSSMKKLAPQMATQSLLFQAGRDQVVLSAGQDIVCQRAPACEKIVFPNAYHEIYMEADDIRERALALTHAFFQDQPLPR